MHVIRARNVHEALVVGLQDLRRYGVERESRNGPVLVFPEPVTTVYERPEERVLFHHERDANPFFHLFEALWMLAGRNDLAYLQHMVARFADYSDDGETLWGAYGYRWRRHFRGCRDQLEVIGERLRADPIDRRSVLQMWSSELDLGHPSEKSRDIPCNTHAYFSINAAGRLDMTVSNRSNDMIWGAYGANAVHFSVLQEYMAALVHRPIGRYWQVSNNLHAYRSALDGLRLPPLVDNPYVRGLGGVPMLLGDKVGEGFDAELERFLSDDFSRPFENNFLDSVAAPMRIAYLVFKDERRDPIQRIVEAQELLYAVSAHDWYTAADDWLGRRLDRRTREADNRALA